MAVELSCPTCRRALNIPESLVGRQVKCAECETVFTAEGDPGVPAASAGTPTISPIQEPMKPRIQAARTSLIGPAIGLGVLAVLNGVVASWLLVVFSFISNMNEAEFHDFHALQVAQMEANRGPGDPPIPEIVKNEEEFRVFIEALSRALTPVSFVCVIAALLTILGVVQMVRLRWRAYHYLIAVLAMVPFTSPVCLIGLPIGIWSLIVLGRADVREAFRHTARPGQWEEGMGDRE